MDRSAAFRPVEWMERDIEVKQRRDGTLLLSSRIPLGACAPHVPSWLAHWAEATPAVTWLAERDGPGRWRRISYADAKTQVDSLTEALLALKKGPECPLAILSDNSVAHGLLTVAAMQAGMPVAPISPAYSLMSRDYAKLKYIFELVRPAAVFVEDGGRFAAALEALDLGDTPVIYRVNPPPAQNCLSFDALAATPATSAVVEAIGRITPDTVAKLLFTSGSTGMPKAVINTQRMLCANQAMLSQARRLARVDGEMAMLEWLPWNHTMAGNGTFGHVLMHGYTLYIDDGRPLPGLIDRTIANLREISPIAYTNAPAGYAALLTALEQDAELCARFFANLQILGYGGARLPDDLYERLQALAVRTCGFRIPFASYYGTTEVAPLSTTTHWATDRTGYIGLPLPGVELKLVPFGDGKYELRQRSVTMMPGYYGRPDLTAEAFDEEGFYRLGDLASFADPDDINEGLMFAGRLAEEFKLLTGTFVPVSTVRVGATAAASPLLLDAVVTGQDQPVVGLMVWLNIEQARMVAGTDQAGAAELAADAKVRAALTAAIARWNAAQQGASSRTIARMLILSEPPQIDAGEITDKGYINQRAVLDRRADDVARLHAAVPDGDIMVFSVRPAAIPTKEITQ